ncbi:MAG: PTS fructose transporter subunit IIA [Rhodospirillaceae bacterium]|nr:PTS fructose transporter subunit IIA [Rhodospirillaceae bacterium]|tara:strand:+ start:387 stop:827 length:441 start_codon:yes stop_codon:yes gene_type:complete
MEHIVQDSNSNSKLGIVIVTHGNLGDELIKVLEHVVGPQEKIETISIGADDDMEARRLDILAAVKKVNDEVGVIILTDMFGGTPSNLAISIMEQEQIDVIAGINLPMLVKLASIRSSKSITEAVSEAREAGQKYIMIASQILGQPQ